MANKRVFAKVKPALLRWARESAGYTLAEAAVALEVEEDDLQDWEAGIESPSIPQLRSISNVYRRPLAVFYLQDVPLSFMVLSDFRRPVHGPTRYSPELTQEIRFAHQRRELASELLSDLGETPQVFTASLGLRHEAEEAGRIVRGLLGITAPQLGQFSSDPEGRSALKMWRSKIEALGVLVFQSTKVQSEEASGFALALPTLPVIVVNRKDPPTRRLFSLVHEFVHVLMQESGVSDLNIDYSVSKSQKNVELFCNRVAAAALMPAHVIRAENTIIAHGNNTEWDDEEINPLARRYGVSREALVIRLISLGLTDWAFYQRKRQQYQKEYLRLKEQQAVTPPKLMKRNMPVEAISNLGRNFVNIVLGNYGRDRITLSEASGYLGLRTRHVEPLQRLAAEA
ncbi:Zn-dependent peptidase ImmA (M78 family)/transcriptional regulator with XRE-family HTH domain [Variovorax boronicumulans]|uniref:Zn-dependent peptidase ImmA (M78 family)/transcriptional regulator with XRE-family HTH domain n=1 Tax=Variovorax boronicumulans TaxID=436515 RepID=A0AAW8D1V3_9BURK|nr:XRE family transcriptional regulator [Variovorax boronicumulans]MDP9893240.1 Zn-dependent peptidase ImmA (M78 family)/transcriptional regulator with XRE-family HTH domain [Variovorax boronicumulans]MDQ0052416.1 Zn-dependent peptidase ImmA (M78 family)/transcriptional regulator with XRE-family HTH domain [Variovorax boronicumulans]